MELKIEFVGISMPSESEKDAERDHIKNILGSELDYFINNNGTVLVYLDKEKDSRDRYGFHAENIGDFMVNKPPRPKEE